MPKFYLLIFILYSIPSYSRVYYFRCKHQYKYTRYQDKFCPYDFKQDVLLYYKTLTKPQQVNKYSTKPKRKKTKRHNKSSTQTLKRK